MQFAERTRSARTPFPWDAFSQLHRVLGRQLEESKLWRKPDKIVPENKGEFNTPGGLSLVYTRVLGIGRSGVGIQGWGHVGRGARREWRGWTAALKDETHDWDRTIAGSRFQVRHSRSRGTRHSPCYRGK